MFLPYLIKKNTQKIPSKKKISKNLLLIGIEGKHYNLHTYNLFFHVGIFLINFSFVLLPYFHHVKLYFRHTSSVVISAHITFFYNLQISSKIG